jgi:hypothetical protein
MLLYLRKNKMFMWPSNNPQCKAYHNTKPDLNLSQVSSIFNSSESAVGGVPLLRTPGIHVTLERVAMEAFMNFWAV